MKIYNFTHFDNLENIINDNGLCSDIDISSRRGNVLHSVANPDIKERRKNKPIIINNIHYGNVGEYVPFYYCVKSPMLYTIQRQDNYDEKIIYFVYDTVSIMSNGNYTWCYSDGNAAVNITNFYNDAELRNIDMQAINSTTWGGVENSETKRKKMAEFLVKKYVPFSLLEFIVTQNKQVYNDVRNILTSYNIDISVRVESKWYYRKENGKLYYW